MDAYFKVKLPFFIIFSAVLRYWCVGMLSDKIRNLINEHEPGESVSGGTVVVARQPIFDLEGNIHAYELLFRDPAMREGFGSKTSHAATSTVMIDGFELMRPSLRPGQRFFINFTEELLVADLANILPPEFCVIEILESVHPTPGVMEAITRLKKRGYQLALDDFIGQRHLVQFIPMMDILKIDVLDRTEEDLRSIVDALKVFKGQLLAEKVETNEMARLCRSLNFNLFQGWFFSKAEIVEGKKLTPSQITKTRLLSYSSDMGDDYTKIGEVVSADVYLSFKLLRYVNSAYFGLTMKICSVLHAMTILGRVKLRQWFCVTALAEIDSTPMSGELVFLSALRAKFLELLVKQHRNRTGAEKELANSLFLVGLFSLLDSMLQTPMPEILSVLPMSEQQVDALVNNQGPLANWLNMVKAYECAEWDTALELAETFNITHADLARAYAEASAWCASIFTMAEQNP